MDRTVLATLLTHRYDVTWYTMYMCNMHCSQNYQLIMNVWVCVIGRILSWLEVVFDLYPRMKILSPQNCTHTFYTRHHTRALIPRLATSQCSHQPKRWRKRSVAEWLKRSSRESPSTSTRERWSVSWDHPAAARLHSWTCWQLGEKLEHSRYPS